MAVPTDIRAVKRPVNTIVDDSGRDGPKRYAVIERSGAKYVQGGNPQPRNGKVIGHIIDHVYVPLEEKTASLAVSNGRDEIKLDTTSKDKIVSATLTKEILAQLGEAANGKIILYSGDKKLVEITVLFNIPEKEPDPYLVDDFHHIFYQYISSPAKKVPLAALLSHI